MALVSIALGLVPGGGRREAGRRQPVRRLRAVALVIVRVYATRVVGVILHLADIAHEVRARVHGFERADFPVDGPGGILKLVLVV